jgi:PAS domain S-box-containing protein
MDGGDPFSRELRSARDRIAELQRRSTADSQPGGGLLPEALAELDGAIEELSVTGHELHEQTAELTATRHALEAERERYQALFEFAPVAYLVTDPVARILEANRAAAALLDVDQRFLVGKPLAAYVASEDRWQFRSMVNWLRKVDGTRVANLPVQFRRRGGVVMDVAVTVQPVRDGEGVLRSLRWVLRDVALAGPERFVADDQMAVEQDDARTRHLEALAELDSAADLDGTVQVLLDAGVRLLDVDGVGLMLVDGEGRLCAVGGSDEVSLAFLRAQEHLVKGPCWHALLLEQSVHSGSIGGDSRWPQLGEAATVNGIVAVLATPIGLYGGPIGACMLFSSSRTWTDDEVMAAEAYASILAAALELAGEAQRTTVLSHRLRETLQRHEVVEQAKGALMARYGIDASEASVKLRDLARRSGRPLAEVARSLLRRLDLDPP